MIKIRNLYVCWKGKLEAEKCDNVRKSRKLTSKLQSMMHQITLGARFTSGAAANFKIFCQLP